MSHSACLTFLFVALFAVFNLGLTMKANNNQNDVEAIKRPSFYVGSRYGRSPYAQNSGRVNVQPRNDRFFLGSRYGKRSNEYVPGGNEDDSQLNTFTMSCVYTGLKNYFSCTKVNDINNYIQQLTSEENSRST